MAHRRDQRFAHCLTCTMGQDRLLCLFDSLTHHVEVRRTLPMFGIPNDFTNSLHAALLDCAFTRVVCCLHPQPLRLFQHVSFIFVLQMIIAVPQSPKDALRDCDCARRTTTRLYVCMLKITPLLSVTEISLASYGAFVKGLRAPSQAPREIRICPATASQWIRCNQKCINDR